MLTRCNLRRDVFSFLKFGHYWSTNLIDIYVLYEINFEFVEVVEDENNEMVGLWSNGNLLKNV